MSLSKLHIFEPFKILKHQSQISKWPFVIGVRKDASAKDLGSCYRVKRGVCTKEGEMLVSQLLSWNKANYSLSAFDKENLLEFSLYWVNLLILIPVGLCTLYLHSQLNSCDIMSYDMCCDLCDFWCHILSQSVIWISHTIYRKINEKEMKRKIKMSW